MEARGPGTIALPGFAYHNFKRPLFPQEVAVLEVNKYSVSTFRPVIFFISLKLARSENETKHQEKLKLNEYRAAIGNNAEQQKPLLNAKQSRPNPKNPARPKSTYFWTQQTTTKPSEYTICNM